MTGNDLRELIYTKLSTLCTNVYYFLADENAMYPHIVFNLARQSKYERRKRADPCGFRGGHVQ